MKHLLISLICTSLFSFAGNEANITRSVEVVNTTPTLTSITLESNATTVNVGDTVQLTVTGTYSDGNSATVDENITYTINPAENAEVNGSVLRAKKDGKVTVQASIDGVNSNTIALNITWVVNGHVLPPEPDPVLNNATLLGIDVNNNGVRDDVERYIYERFGKDPEYPKTKIALAMQDAWATQKILETPTIESKKYLDDAIDCQFYWFDKKNKVINDEIIELASTDFDQAYELDKQVIIWERKNKVFNDIKLKDMKLNTKERILRKFKFNEACSGHIFRGRKESIENCQTNIDTLGE